ncbi:hypothetical protein L917_19485 [Phytophthora nicotianae]|uniref:Protein kinase domain-containing protein n=1 Tax=Phytophthora nicotianae TaxID=4792 RepID=W2K5Y4_PHYNI|nr:hypothetical protein L917_19485 [Phytophthora nicotianae]
MRGEVIDFNSSIHTSEQATMDADSLYKAGEGRWGTDKKTFIDMLVSSPLVHVRNINKAYMEKYKVDLIHVINAKFHGDTKRALLFRVRSILEPMGLLAELFEMAVKRSRKNAYSLSACAVQYYHLLGRICSAYRHLYRQDLCTRIRSEVRSEYCQLLLSVFEAAGVSTPISAWPGAPSIAASRGSVMPMIRGTVLCSSCAAASDPFEEWCRCCGDSMHKPKEEVERNLLAKYLRMPKRKPTAGTTEEETTEVTEVTKVTTTETVEVTEEVAATTEETTDVTEVTKVCPRSEAWRKVYEVAIDLQDLHDQNIIHANLKPSNLIVGRDGRGHVSELESCKMVEEITSYSTKSRKEELRW